MTTEPSSTTEQQVNDTSELPDRTAPVVASTPSPTYKKVEFHAIFTEYNDALAFAQDPFFRNENPHQNGVTPVIAKAPGADFLCAFSLYIAHEEEITGLVRDLANQYNGKLDGDPEPEPEPEPEPATAANVKSTPW